MAEKTKKPEKELSKGKIIGILLIVFLLMPILILSLIYRTNDNFKNTANQYLVNIPGSIGNHFKSYPTKEELAEQLSKIADYLVSIDENRAEDKLTLIKNDNQETYTEIIKVMAKLNQNKTARIIDEVRRNTLREDIVLSTIEEIETEKLNYILEKVKYFERLSLPASIEEINYSLSSGLYTYKELAVVFENMKAENAASILKYLEEDTTSSLLSSFNSKEKSDRIKEFLIEMKDRESFLENMAVIYSTDNPDSLVKIIGNSSTYNLDDLSTIYNNIGILKGAEVLSKIDNDDFIYSLINKMKEVETLSDASSNSTRLLSAMKIYKEYDQNVINLSKMYEKMSDNQIAQIIRQMYRNTNQPKIYHIGEDITITISDEDLALSVLQNFDDKKLASILSNLDNNLSSEISRKLAFPSQ